MKKPLMRVAAALLALPLLVEGGLRATSIGDFPLYDANSEIGYIPKPSQAGSFLWRSDWQFNAKHMGAAEFMPDPKVDTLLVGDSIVLGGNTYRRQERLGPRLSEAVGHPVWPISAGSWALRNELAYLRLHPEVARGVAGFVFVLNSGDFGEPSSWSCEQTHPRMRPAVLSVYLFQKYVYNWAPCGTVPQALKMPPGDWKNDLRAFATSDPAQGKPISFILYPDQAESKDARLLRARLEVHGAELLAQAGPAASVYSVGRDLRWRSDFYKDDIHPTPDGMKVLADIISQPMAMEWPEP